MVIESIRRQATKLREHVAKQQQALMKQLGHFDALAIMTDVEELKCHQQLQKLYRSTRECKHFQKDIVRCCQGYVSFSSKQMEIVRKLAEDCCKYGSKEEFNTLPLAEVAFQVGTSHNLMEEDRKTLLGILSDEVCEPLRTLVRDVQLEDARLLVRHYERLWQQVENQAIEVVRQQSKSRNAATSENSLKIQMSEAKLDDLKSRLVTLGKEANAAMSLVETKQQQQTEDYLLLMVEAERFYHQNILIVLENLLQELTSSSHVDVTESDPDVADLDRYYDCSGYCGQGSDDEIHSYFVARVVHPFDALEEGELNLRMDDFVVVYQVSEGWYKGESKGELGWFPSAYVQRVDGKNNAGEGESSEFAAVQLICTEGDTRLSIG